MSSSFTDQPPPHDPRHEEGYTSTPAAPERKQEAEDLKDGLPKLGSLAQKARGKQLKQARGILFVIGALTVLVNGGLLIATPSLVKQEIDKEILKQGGVPQVDPLRVEEVRNEMLILNYAIHGLFFSLGVLFLIFGALVYRFPLAMTVTSLVLYLLASLATGVLAPAALASGAIVRILIIIALAKSIQSAYAYEKERRAQAEYEPA
ncbi:MAG TPA: hypothetical protein VH682_00145 [Gemmataceae bacterium]|jgi:VIT1/CCC1 family predicted Fe2+/Mn2+ transporter